MQDRQLLAHLFSGGDNSQSAWREFLGQYSNLFLKIIWRFERNHDEVMERYLYICQKLAARDFAILRRFEPEQEKYPPKLSTWLTIVVKNLCVESYHLAHGRKRYPVALLRLTEFDRKVFELRYWKGYSDQDIDHHMQLGNHHAADSVHDALSRIDSVIIKSRFKHLSIEDKPLSLPYDDKYPPVLPSDSANALVELGTWIENHVARLTDQQQLVIRMRFWEDMTVPEIAKAMKIEPVRRVYTMLQQGLQRLRVEAKREGGR